ncbi:hypothetical protein [Mangrovibacterium lignilyticum]|uniref:hypothetical protein n=1 Tax=Mangrovibacterium lignilyticum TaxID=2668052 RepID=UPI0013D00A13|nr:hypothetical protein [Mangrovibacterium lignilyticum]
MKKQYFNDILIVSFVLLLLGGCSKEETETNGKEGIVQVELAFSENYASYSWTMGFQLVSSSNNVSLSGHNWDENTRPEEFASWLTVTDDVINSGQYQLKTIDKVSAVTLNGTAELRDDAESLAPLTVTARIYVDGELIKMESASFEPGGFSYLTVIVSNEDF